MLRLRRHQSEIQASSSDTSAAWNACVTNSVSLSVDAVVANSLRHRAAFYAAVTWNFLIPNIEFRVPYLQLQVTGVLTGKFTLHAQTPTVDSGKTDTASTMIYPTERGLKLVNAKDSFTNVMK